MLKFFRQLRQQTLDSGQMKKYTLYAIGEILLVVIGILIALQINNWNENRKNKLLSIEFLQAIKSNLESDLEQVRRNEIHLNKFEQRGFNLWNFLYEEGKEVDSSQLQIDYLQVSMQREFSPTQTAYDNIVSSGNINLIKNNQLKDLLAEFYREDIIINNNKAQRNRVENLYYDIRFDFIHPLMLRDFLNQRLLLEKEIDLTSYAVDWESVRISKEYQKTLGRLLALRIPSRKRIEVNRKNINRLLQLINAEINK